MAGEATLSILLQLRDDASMKMDAFQGKLNEIGYTLNKVSIAAAAMGTAMLASIYGVISAAENENKAAQRLANTIDNMGSSYVGLTNAVETASSAQESAAQAAQDAGIAYQEAGMAAQDAAFNVTDAANAEKDAQFALADAVAAVNDLLLQQSESAGNLTAAQHGVTAAQHNVIAAQEAYAKVMAHSKSTDLEKLQAQDRLNSANDAVVSAQNRVTELNAKQGQSATKLAEAQQKVKEAHQNVTEASTKATQAQEKNTIAQEKLTKALNDYTTAQQTAAQAAQTLQSAQSNLATAQAQGTTSYKDCKDAIDNLVEAQMRTTNYSRTEQLDALRTLVQYTGDYNQALKDLPVALDLAAQHDISLSEATKLLGKINDGVIQRLKQMGIVLSDHAIAAAKAGDSTEALAEIEKDCAGAAEQTANPLTIMKNTFGDIADKIGTAVLPAVKGFVDAITPVLKWVGDFIAAHPGLVQAIIGIAGAIGTLLLVFGTLGIVVPKIIDGIRIAWWLLNLGFITSPIFLVCAAIVVAIGLIALAIYEIVKHWKTVENAFKHAWDFIKEHWDLILGILLGPIVLFVVEVVKHWDAVKAAFKKVVDWIEGLWTLLWDGAKTAFKDFCNFFVGLAEGFANVWVKAINWVIDCIDKIHVTIPSWVPGIGGNSIGFNISHIGEVKLPRLAAGGDVTSGGSVLVGENGPEVLSLPRGASVTPLSGAGGNVTVNVTVQGSMLGSHQELANVIRTELLKVSRRNGGAITGATGLA